MTRFHIIGAFDRHNYGDLLFPLIHTHAIKSQLGNSAEIYIYSINDSDLTKTGALKTNTTRNLKNSISSPTDKIIMAGGDILAADWVTMLGHLVPKPIFFALRVFKKIAGFKTGNKAAMLLSKSPYEFPYVLSKSEITAKIFYTCVGGSGFNRKKDKNHLDIVTQKLKSADFVSVREIDTYKMLTQKGLECKLTPDTALIMSDIYTIATLQNRPWKKSLITKNNFNNEKYVAFQAGKHFAQKNIDKISKQLIEISRKKSISILLIPIGRALGHEDDKVLIKIFEKLAKNGIPAALLSSPHILDIMASIALSNGYIGTSLHGAITAYSFQKKVCGFCTDRVHKLGSFLNTWMNKEDYKAISNDEFQEPFISLTKESAEITDNTSLQKQKKLVHQEIQLYIKA